MRRLATALLALVALFGVAVAAPQPAVADGPIGSGVEFACDVTQSTSPLGIVTNIVTSGAGYELCEKIGDGVQSKVNEAWDAVWDSVLGDVIKSAADVAKWLIKRILTFSLYWPSVDLESTGLFGRDATLAGMLTWLGLVIATFGMMWQLGKMAVTGQTKHAGRAMAGWVENTLLSACGVGMFVLLLKAGDLISTGLVNATFKDPGRAYERIAAVMVPKPTAVANPVTMMSVVAVLLLIGFIQLVMIFLRQSAIPIICLLLPVAGAGRVGGDTTRQWAPKLITAGLVVVAYKPILAVIICTGFLEFGQAKTLPEWLRGCATLVLAILAPGPLTKIFAPFGAAVGGGLSAGGASGALSAAAGYFGRAGDDGKDGKGGGAEPASPVDHARLVEQSMGSQGGGSGRGEAGSDAQGQAARNEANARVPEQGTAPDGAVAGGTAGANAGAGASGGQAAGASGAAGAGGAAAGGAGIAIQVYDGVNNTIQGAGNQMGNGGSPQ